MIITTENKLHANVIMYLYQRCLMVINLQDLKYTFLSNSASSICIETIFKVILADTSQYLIAGEKKHDCLITSTINYCKK